MSGVVGTFSPELLSCMARIRSGIVDAPQLQESLLHMHGNEQPEGCESSGRPTERCDFEGDPDDDQSGVAVELETGLESTTVFSTI